VGTAGALEGTSGDKEVLAVQGEDCVVKMC
jgi:hypothetical protein